MRMQSNAKRIVCSELSFYRHTHHIDIASYPVLFRINGITQEEGFENLCILLKENVHIATEVLAAALDLPTNEEALNAATSGLPYRYFRQKKVERNPQKLLDQHQCL